MKNKCQLDYCERVKSAKGYCGAHYEQMRLGKPLKPIQARRPRRSFRPPLACLERDEQGRKHCPQCDDWLPLIAYLNHPRTADGLQAACTRCIALQSAHGLSRRTFERALALQDHKCSICLTEDPGSRTWNLDHNHATGAARGVLCPRCNLELGWIEKHNKPRGHLKEPGNLERARAYLHHDGDLRSQSILREQEVAA